MGMENFLPHGDGDGEALPDGEFPVDILTPAARPANGHGRTGHPATTEAVKTRSRLTPVEAETPVAVLLPTEETTSRVVK